MTKALCLIGCAIFLASCGSKPTASIIVKPELPKDLTAPEPRPKCEMATMKDAGICIVDYDQALGRANGKIVAIEEIVNG